MAYAMFINLFLMAAEVFKEVYSDTEHLIHLRYMYFGIGTHVAIVPYMWLSVFCSFVAFLLFLIPATRRHWVTLNLGCLLIFSGVYIEKGMGLVIPGLTPDTLGEIYQYFPTGTEFGVAAGVFGVGGLVFTLLVKIATPIMVPPDQPPALPAD
jgi:molybdopterin-containing oxidoreductase family membrane subunit